MISSPRGSLPPPTGFPGFSPDTAGNWSRANWALYADIEADPLPNWTLGLAVRWEHYEDFGSTTNGKLASRFSVNDRLALRGTLSTGFRAPTPGQANAINATSKIGGAGAERALSIVSTIAPTSPVGAALGGAPLKPERSTHLSLGLVHDGESLGASLDCYRIKVRDRLALSRDIELNRPDLGPARVRDDLLVMLESTGLTSARSWNYINYFTNDFTTVTSGCETTGSYRLHTAWGATVFTGAYNVTDTKVDSYTPGGPLDDAREIRDYEAGLPKRRLLLSVSHSHGRFDLTVRLNSYSGWYDSEEDLEFDGYSMVEAMVHYAATNHLTVTLGAENIFDETPEENPNARTGLGNRYSQYAPGGFNGRFAYLKVSMEW